MIQVRGGCHCVDEEIWLDGRKDLTAGRITSRLGNEDRGWNCRRDEQNRNDDRVGHERVSSLCRKRDEGGLCSNLEETPKGQSTRLVCLTVCQPRHLPNVRLVVRPVQSCLLRAIIC